jgi:hypothetical protein
MDNLSERVAALEHHIQTMNRQLRGWRRLAWGLGLLALGGWVLHASPGVTAQSGGRDGHPGDVGELLKTLRAFLAHVTLATDAEGRREIIITKANLRIVNGLGRTDCTDAQGNPIPDCPNGLGNLIVGYNELRGFEDVRTGSHNMVVGREHNFSRFGGMVVGSSNTISGDFAVASGGQFNTAGGFAAAVSGGAGNIASGFRAAVSGGGENTASGADASVSGGVNNFASGSLATVSGGNGNTASGDYAVVSGGNTNTAAGSASLVSGGNSNFAGGGTDTVSGGIGNAAIGAGASVSGGASNIASGFVASISGGRLNTASGPAASVSGGHNRTATGEFDWAAGSLLEDE